MAQRTAPPDIQPGFSTKYAPVGYAWVSTIGSGAGSRIGRSLIAPTTSAVPSAHAIPPAGVARPAPSGVAKSSPVPTATGVPAGMPASGSRSAPAIDAAGAIAGSSRGSIA